MTLAGFRAASNEILGAFRTAWEANSGAVNGGTVPSVHYPGMPFSPTDGAAWGRIVIRHRTAEQATLQGDALYGSGTRFEKFGDVTVQIFQPVQPNGGVVLGQELADVAKAAFEGERTANGIWFQNVVITEVGVDGPWFQFNVTASFRYDELV